MCEATLIMSGIGLGMQAVGGASAASGQRREADFQAGQLEREASLTDSARADVLRRGGQAAGQARMDGSQVIAAQRAIAGASGVAVDSGSVLDLMADSRLMSEFDAQTLENNAAREAWGLEVESQRQRQQAGFVRRTGKAQEASTLLTTGGRVAEGAVGAVGRYQTQRIGRG